MHDQISVMISTRLSIQSPTDLCCKSWKTEHIFCKRSQYSVWMVHLQLYYL